MRQRKRVVVNEDRSAVSHVKPLAPMHRGRKLELFLPRLEEAVSSLYRDLVIRVPAQHMSPDEVVGLVDDFGPVEYLRSASLSFDPEAETTTCVEEGCLHVVRFNEAQHAVHCYLSLHGSLMDVGLRAEQVGVWLQVIEQSLPNKKWSNNEEVAELVDHLRRKKEVTPLGGDCNRLIFIACDFLHAAFFIDGTPKAQLLSSSTRLQSTPAADPAKVLRQRLCAEGAAFKEVHPLVMSHGINWEDFIFTSNYASFFFCCNVNIHGASFDAPSIVLRTLRREQFNVGRALRAMDSSTRIEELLLDGGLSLSKETTSFSSLVSPLMFLAGLLVACLVFLIIAAFAVF